jgi:uncharacterized protein (TIGR03435 family)
MNSHADSLWRRDAALLSAGLLAILALVLTASALLPVGLHAQAPAAGGPTFEVASIKANHSGDGRIGLGMQPGGRYTAQKPLRLIIQNAYRVQGFQVVNAPDWTQSERYDISAKADGTPTQEQVQQMVQALLADRFKLQVHRETKEMPIYALVMAREDGRLGPKLKVSTAECGNAGRGRGGVQPPPAPGQPLQCGMRLGPGNLLGGGMTMTNLATSIANSVNRVVVDRTGLTGNYDFELIWTPELPQGGGPGGGLGPPGGGPNIDPNGPSLFTAVQEQLGLKLDSTRGPVETLVIDRVERPTEN